MRRLDTREVVGTHAFAGVTTMEQPIRASGRWFVVAGGDLYAFDALAGLLWKRDTDAIGRPEAVGRQVFVRTATGIQTFDAVDGTPIGQTPTAATVTGFAVADDKLYVNQGSELAVYTTAGAPLWTVPLVNVVGTPTVGGGVVYVPAGQGPDYAVVAVDADGCGAATCDELHRVTYFTRTPPNEYVLASGRLFASGFAWGLFGFAPSPA